jgi:DNA polymerase III gamma/tau subunit
VNRDLILNMAKDAAGFDGTTSLEKSIVLYAAMSKNFLYKFADLIAKAEREACAQICDSYAENSSSPMNFAENCAKTIRERK